MKRGKLPLIFPALLLIIAINGCISAQTETTASQFVVPPKDVSVQWVKERYNELNAGKDKKVIVYCQSGRRSKITAEKLSKLGFMNIYNMVGGLEQWKVYGESDYIR